VLESRGMRVSKKARTRILACTESSKSTRCSARLPRWRPSMNCSEPTLAPRQSSPSQPSSLDDDPLSPRSQLSACCLGIRVHGGARCRCLVPSNSSDAPARWEGKCAPQGRPIPLSDKGTSWSVSIAHLRYRGAGWSSPAAHQAHNLKIRGSSFPRNSEFERLTQGDLLNRSLRASVRIAEDQRSVAKQSRRKHLASACFASFRTMSVGPSKRSAR
jgi:hypothetical protein